MKALFIEAGELVYELRIELRGILLLKKNAFNVSFCVTASPTDTPSMEDDFLRIFRWVGFLRIIALKI